MPEHPPPDRAALKAKVMEMRGYWHPFHEGLLEHNPAFLAAYLDFVTAPWKSAKLEPKVREFIYVAVDGGVSHLYERGLRRHAEYALAHGATQAELLQVVQIAAVTGHYTHDLGMGVLVEELQRTDPAALARPLGAAAEALKSAFVAEVGYWPDAGDAILRFAPHFIDGFLAWRRAAWSGGPLSPKVKELIALAMSAAPSSLFEPGVRIHTRRALQYGASPEEIAEVLQLASAIAIHTCTIGIPAVIEAVREKEKK